MPKAICTVLHSNQNWLTSRISDNAVIRMKVGTPEHENMSQLDLFRRFEGKKQLNKNWGHVSNASQLRKTNSMQCQSCESIAALGCVSMKPQIIEKNQRWHTKIENLENMYPTGNFLWTKWLTTYANVKLLSKNTAWSTKSYSGLWKALFVPRNVCNVTDWQAAQQTKVSRRPEYFRDFSQSTKLSHQTWKTRRNFLQSSHHVQIRYHFVSRWLESSKKDVKW